MCKMMVIKVWVRLRIQRAWFIEPESLNSGPRWPISINDVMLKINGSLGGISGSFKLLCLGFHYVSLNFPNTHTHNCHTAVGSFQPILTHTKITVTVNHKDGTSMTWAIISFPKYTSLFTQSLSKLIESAVEDLCSYRLRERSKGGTMKKRYGINLHAQIYSLYLFSF